MRHFDNVTLFCPETVSTEGYTWRRYLLHGVTVEKISDTEGSSAVMYVFDGEAKAYCGGAACRLPKIGVGCAVVHGADFTDKASVVDELPSCGCMKVKSVEHYYRRKLCYTKVILG